MEIMSHFPTVSVNMTIINLYQNQREHIPTWINKQYAGGTQQVKQHKGEGVGGELSFPNEMLENNVVLQCLTLNVNNNSCIFQLLLKPTVTHSGQVEFVKYFQESFLNQYFKASAREIITVDLLLVNKVGK